LNLLIIEFVGYAFQTYTYILLARIIMSWISLPDNPVFNNIGRFVYDVTEPFLAVFRRVLPMVNLGGAGLDLSPIIAFFVLRIMHGIVIQVLIQIV
jgi:YggT family protein